MLASAIVVFREVLEAALVVGIMLAATEGLPRRNFWIGAGVVGGLAGSILVAGFADAIAAAASGFGQEYLNASVLFIAVAVLGWSIIWMRRHGRELSTHAKKVGQSVAAGDVPIHMLAIVVGLAVLREGAEAVLFLYGIAAGQDSSPFVMLLGGALGVAAGIAVGFLMYRGLVRLAARHLFSVTSWLLAFLAAGMASQAAGDLVSAGILPPIVTSAWDTSRFLSDRDLLGRVLHTMFGYESRPALIQVLFYLATLVTIGVMMRAADTRRPASRAGKIAAIAIPFAALALASPGTAHAEQKVYSPIVHQGEFSLEARGDTAVDRGQAEEDIQNHVYELEYGVTNRWMTALVGELAQDKGGPLRYEATGWENIYQLFEQGEAWVDSGVYFEYEHGAGSNAPDLVEGKLLLEKQLGPTVETVNFIAQKEVGTHAEEGTEFEYAARTKLRWKPYLEPAIEAFGDMGQINATKPSEMQEQRIGPVILGAIPLAGSLAFNYELGWLFGLTRGSSDQSIKWLAEIEYHF